jgi:hypothetical protein
VLRALLAGFLALCAVGVLTGCGAERTAVPPVNRAVRPEAPKVFKTADVRFRYPSNWTLVRGKAPAVAHVLSGRALITLWAYRRRIVPSTREQAALARRNLVRRVRRRDRSFRLGSSRLRRLSGGRAVELVGTGTISRRRVRIRSLHLYRRKGEYVLDAYAPPDVARTMDGLVFRPLVASLRVRGRPKVTR